MHEERAEDTIKLIENERIIGGKKTIQWTRHTQKNRAKMTLEWKFFENGETCVSGGIKQKDGNTHRHTLAICNYCELLLLRK